MSSVADLADQILLTPAQLLVALAEHEQQAAVLALAASHVEARGDWALDGSVSMRAWLRDRGRMSTRDANSLVRRGRFLNKFETVADAAVSRTLSAGQLGELEQLHQPKFDTLLGEHQQLLVEQIAPLDVAATKTACSLWRQRAEAIIDATEPAAEAARSLTMTRAGDGALLGKFDARRRRRDRVRESDPQRLHLRRHQRHPHRATTQRRRPVRHRRLLQQEPPPPRHPPPPAPPGHLRRRLHPRRQPRRRQRRHPTTNLTGLYRHLPVRLPDPHHRARRRPDTRKGFGRSRYSVPRRLFRQVAARDGGCRFPGCDRNVRHCDAHHIRYWRRHGHTEYPNLVLLCSRHHHHVHQLDLHLKLLPNGELHVTWTDGHERTSQPRGAPPRRPPT